MENEIDTNAGGRKCCDPAIHITELRHRVLFARAMASRPGSSFNKMALIALAAHYDWRVELSFPSVERIAEWTGMNRKTVYAALRRLEAAGLIEDSGARLADRDKPSRTVKAYRLTFGNDGERVQ